jgi:hypothetical protein
LKRGGSPGRPKGSKNFVNPDAGAILDKAFIRVGDMNAFVKWGRENPGEFYKIWAKRVPANVRAELSGEVIIRLGTGYGGDSGA